MDQDAFVAVCCEKPAVHRFPGSMGKRAHEMCRVIAEEYGGDTAAICTTASTGAGPPARVTAPPGVGGEQATTLLAVPGTRRGCAGAAKKCRICCSMFCVRARRGTSGQCGTGTRRSAIA